MLFEAALDDISIHPDLTNQALDIELAEGARIVIRRYRLPWSIFRKSGHRSRVYPRSALNTAQVGYSGLGWFSAENATT